MDECDYDVFLTYRGPDTCIGFTCHLYTRLRDAGIRTYRDDEDLRKGEEFSPGLLRAIKQSKISIPIFSQGYASSVWCLNELVQIMECMASKRQTIIPVFYHVEPSEVRRQTGCYSEAFLSHEKKTQYDEETIRKWRAALHHAGCLKGMVVNGMANSLGEEGSIVEALVANVLRLLNRYFVGIERHVEGVMKLLNVGSRDVCGVGIHGIGGTGKTTIAKHVYERIFHLFDGCSFLENVRENPKKPGGLVNLRGQLISDLLGAMHRQIYSVDDVIKSIRSRFFRKKFLIVLDDIEPSFGPTISEILDWLGSGSRIIITTRDEHALDELKVFVKYKVGGMQPDEALKLFHVHAFRDRPAPDEFATLSREIVSAVDDLPLTIEVVGSYLFSRSKHEWEETLDKLLGVPIEEKLMVPINALPKKQKQIFLDIACFFVGEDKNVACHLWSDHDYPAYALVVLQDSKIVKFENNKLWMHDQLRDLGRKIMKQEHLEAGKPRRLWIHEEAMDVLMNKEGRASVEGVLLKFDCSSQFTFTEKHFRNTPNIRFLQLDQANIKGDFESLLPSLKWLHWQGCPRNICAGNLDLKELVILDLSWSKVREKWSGWSQIKKAKKLKVLNLTGCVDLIRTPDLSHYQHLERLILERCFRLVEIGSSVKCLQHLVSLNLRSCTELNKLPEEVGSLISLQEILIDGTAVQEIPASIGNMQNLRILSACNCLRLIQLADSISRVKTLKVLALTGTKITKLPMSIGKLGVLAHLSINQCRSILKLPTSLETLTSLIELDLSSTGIVKLPDDIKELKNLKVLKIDFTFVRELPSTIWELKGLQELHASRCRSLDGKISSKIKQLLGLRILRLGYSRIRGLPDTISELTNLQTLDLLHCDELRKVPKLPSSLISLSVSSKLIKKFPSIGNLVTLGELFLADGSLEQVLPVQDQTKATGRAYLRLENLLELKILQISVLKILPVGLYSLTKLRKLSLGCIHVEELPRLPSSLFTLSLRHYKSQTGLPDLSYLNLLSEFELIECAVTEVPGLKKFKFLRVFRISHCNLQQLDELESLTSLASLYVSNCQSLAKLPDLSKLGNLKDIRIRGCPKIPNIRSVEHLNSFKKPSSSVNEAESSSEVDVGKLAYTKHSSIEGVKCKDKGMTTSAKDDDNAFPVNDEDKVDYIIPEGEKNEPAESIASSDSDESVTETMGASSPVQSSPSVGGSSTTIEPDKDSSLSVDLTGTETTDVSPSTEQGDTPLDRASTVPSSPTIVSAVPPAARPQSSSATDKDKALMIVEADLGGDGEESLFSRIESLLSGDSGKQNTGTETSQASQFDLQAYHNALQVVEDIMSLGLLAVTCSPKLLGHLQKSLNFLVAHNMPEVSTVGRQCVYLKSQNFIQSVADSLSSQQKILIECERFERELKKEKYLLASDKDEVLLLKKQFEEKAKSVADDEQVIAKLQAEIEALKLAVENAKSELSSLSTKRSEKVKELKNKYEQVLSMKSENPSMEKKRNQAQETIDKINAEWNELYVVIKGRLASK